MNKKFLIVGFVLLVVILLVVLVNKQKSEIKIIEVDYANLNSKISEYKEGLVFIPYDKEDNILTDYFVKNYKTTVLKANISVDELSVLINGANLDLEVKKPMYLIFDEGKLLGGFDANLSETEANEMFRYYFFNEIPSSMKKYKELSTADEFIKKFNSKNYTVSVFGYDACSFCNLYKPVFNKVAGDYNLDIYYFNTDTYDAKELNKIYDLDITIPKECTTTGEDTTLASGYPKPITLITKKSKLVGCIKGYVSEEVLVKKLKEYKVLESGK